MKVTKKQHDAVFEAVNKAVRALEEQKKAGRLGAAEYKNTTLVLCTLRDTVLYGARGLTLRSYFKDIGAKGGSAAAESLTKQQRSERASKASKARWGLVKGGKQ